MAYLALGCRCLLLVVFAVAVLGKVRDGTAFRRAVADLVPVAGRRVGWLATAVVGAEITVVVLLAVPATAVLGLVGSLALLAAFTGAIAAALRRGSTAPCHCFGASANPLRGRELVRNAVLLLFAGAGLAGELTRAHAEPLGMAMAAATGAVLAVLVLAYDALTDLFLGTPAVPTRRPREGMPS